MTKDELRTLSEEEYLEKFPVMRNITPEKAREIVGFVLMTILKLSFDKEGASSELSEFVENSGHVTDR